jgi:hypothetical protein
MDASFRLVIECPIDQEQILAGDGPGLFGLSKTERFQSFERSQLLEAGAFIRVPRVVYA